MVRSISRIKESSDFEDHQNCGSGYQRGVGRKATVMSYFFFFFFFCFLPFLGPLPPHMEVPRLGGLLGL